MATAAIVPPQPHVTESATRPWAVIDFPQSVADLPSWLTGNPSPDPWASKPVPLPMVDIIAQVPEEPVSPKGRTRPKYKSSQEPLAAQRPFPSDAERPMLTGSLQARLQTILDHPHKTTASAKQLLTILAFHAGNQEHPGQCWPSINSLVRETNLSRSTVLRSIKRLGHAGWIDVSRSRGLANVYTIFAEPDSNWCHRDTGVTLNPKQEDIEESVEKLLLSPSNLSKESPAHPMEPGVTTTNDEVSTWVTLHWDFLKSIGWKLQGGAINVLRRDSAQFRKVQEKMAKQQGQPTKEVSASKNYLADYERRWGVR